MTALIDQLKEHARSRRALRVLLIEDDLFDYQAVRRHMRAAPYIELVHAQTLEEAIVKAQSEGFDCFILDWYLPDGSGERFLEFAASTVPWTPAIIMTSSMGNMLKSSALELGAQDYIIKGNFSAEDLHRAIDYAIARKNAERLRWNTLNHERMGFINQIVAGVAHEINNPIAWVRSNIDLLHMQADQGDVERKDTMELCQECIEGVDRIASVVKVLRSYAESGQMRLELTHIHDVLAQLLDSFVARSPFEDVHADLRVERALPMVLVDPGAIRRALEQIVLNAYQAAAAHAAERVPRVQVLASVRDRQLQLEVHDSGAGMDPELATRVFEPFYSSRRATRLGMGLAIARDVIVNHRGAIEVMEASPLGGARVQIRLPIL